MPSEQNHRYPLETYPIDSPHFMQDNEIKARILGIAEQMETIELSSENK